MAASALRPARKPNTAAKTRGVERNDSLNAVTSRTARAMQQTGQWPPTGDSASDRVSTVAGSWSGCSRAGAAAGSTGNGNCGATADVLLAADVELRLVALDPLRAGVATQKVYERRSDEGERHELPPPRHPGNEDQHGNNAGGEAEPDEMHAGHDDFEPEQQRAEQQPVPHRAEVGEEINDVHGSTPQW